MKNPDLREALLYDDNGKCIGIKDDKDILPEVRAAWDKMLSEDADRMESEHKAKIEAAQKETGGRPVVFGDWGLCLAEMVREGIAPQAYYDTFRAATTSGIPPLLPSDIATELFDRVEKRLASRTTLPEGMSDVEHAWSLLDAERATEENASVGVKATEGRKKGQASSAKARVENNRRKASERTRTRREGDELKLAALLRYRAGHPECTLPEARDHLATIRELAFQSKRAAEDWLRDRVTRGDITPPFPLASPGRRPGRPGTGKARRVR